MGQISFSQHQLEALGQRQSPPIAPNTLVWGDCMEILPRVTSRSVDLVFADPPFNTNFDYDVYRDLLDSDAYLEWTRAWMAQVYRVLKPHGTFWLAMSDEYVAELKVIATREFGFNLRSWVVWFYTFGVNCKKGFSRSHTHLLHLTRDTDHFTFNVNEIRVPSARQLIYGDVRAKPSGRLPDNTWILRPQEADMFDGAESTWCVPRVCGTFDERVGFHGCQMPEQVLGRIIKVSSHQGGVVLDPFVGSGTTLAVAKKLNRQYIGVELSENYATLAAVRLAKAELGQPLAGGDPIMTPKKKRQGKNDESSASSASGGSESSEAVQRPEEPVSPAVETKGDLATDSP